MPQSPLTEAQRQVLRDRLALARQRKAEKAAATPAAPKPPRPAKAEKPKTMPGPQAVLGLHAQWTEDKWRTSPILDAQARLALLRADFETGCHIVGQRSDVNDPATYRCFVCGKPVPERSPSGAGNGWVWKHDYLEHSTGLFRSIVICDQKCHLIYSNDRRLQQKVKDLMSGRPTTQADDTKNEEEVPA